MFAALGADVPPGHPRPGSILWGHCLGRIVVSIIMYFASLGYVAKW